MQWNSEANNNDLVSDINYLCDSDNTTYPLADKSRNSNFALDRITALILKSDARWEWDDTANTSELLDTTSNLASGTQKYALSVTWLKIGKIRIKDSAGNWITLTPRDRRRLTDSQMTASSGTPSYYDRLGNWIYLYPAPNYASNGGLEVQFQRAASYFIPNDTTKTPGFATHFHRLVSLYASLDYCEINGLSMRAAMIRAKIVPMEAELITHYSERNEDEQPSISFQRDDYGQTSLISEGGVSLNPKGF